MQIRELFETPPSGRISPVVKIGDLGDELRLADELERFVVTPLIEQHLTAFLDSHVSGTDAASRGVGTWVSGPFGSGKSHLTKVLSLLLANPVLVGQSARQRLLSRIAPSAPGRERIEARIGELDRRESLVVACNLGALDDGLGRPLAQLLLAELHRARGYCDNVLFAQVIEAELDRRGELGALHQAASARAGRPWSEIRRNAAAFDSLLCEAASEVAPELFPTAEQAARALARTELGQLHNADHLVRTVLQWLEERPQRSDAPQQMLLALDEVGAWIAGDEARLLQLQSLLEQAGSQGAGRLRILVSTPEDLEATRAGLDGQGRVSWKSITSRFSLQLALSAEHAALVVRERVLRKPPGVQQAMAELYASRPGRLRELGELDAPSRLLPSCEPAPFGLAYPLLPWQVELIPEMVRVLRARAGHGALLSGSTRSLLAVVQDVLCAGRRPYLDLEVGALVSLDEVFHNLATSGEIPSPPRAAVQSVVDELPDATPRTRAVAEVLVLLELVEGVPATVRNVARGIATHVTDGLPTLCAAVAAELDRLVEARRVACFGESYELLDDVGRSFAEQVAAVDRQLAAEDRRRGFFEHFVRADGPVSLDDWLAIRSVSSVGRRFGCKLRVDGRAVAGRRGEVWLHVSTPLSLGGGDEADPGATTALERQSLQPDAQHTITIQCAPRPELDQAVGRLLATSAVVAEWKGDADRGEQARLHARRRDSQQLPILERQVLELLDESLRAATVVFRGASHRVAPTGSERTSDALRRVVSSFWPALYPKLERMPVAVANGRQGIAAVLRGESPLPDELRPLQLLDEHGRIQPASPLLDALRMVLRERAGCRGADLLKVFAAPPFGWDRDAVRVGIAAMVRGGLVRVLRDGMELPPEPLTELEAALVDRRAFERLRLEVDESSLDPEGLTAARALVVELGRSRGIDETPPAISEAAGRLAAKALASVEAVRGFCDGAGLEPGAAFTDGVACWTRLGQASDVASRVRQLQVERVELRAGWAAIADHHRFVRERGRSFAELGRSVAGLRAMRGWLPPHGAATRLLDAYDEAVRDSGYLDSDREARLRRLWTEAEPELGLLDAAVRRLLAGPRDVEPR